MELVNTFHVDADPATAWAVLTDLERIAPCLPGATLGGQAGDEYAGAVSVRIGPITASYEGTARFLNRDEPTRATLLAEGRDRRGQGGARATVDAVLRPAAGGGTTVHLTTDLHVSGKLAAFGRGMFEEVADKLLAEFVSNLEVVVADTRRDAVDRRSAATAEASVAVGRVVAGPLLRRAVPVLGVLVVVLLARRSRRRRRSLGSR